MPLRRLVSAALAFVGLSGAVVARAAFSNAGPAPSPSVDTIGLEAVSLAQRTLMDSAVLKQLSGGRTFTIQSTGEFRIAGQLSGTASIVDFGTDATLKGDIPTMNVLNAVSETDQARGIAPPASLDIRYDKKLGAITSKSFSVLLNKENVIVGISPVPASAPSSPARIENAPTPPTVPNNVKGK